LPQSVNRLKEDDRFFRVQSLIRARYSDPDVAARVFAEQAKGPQKCMALMGEGILASRLNRINDAAAAFDAALACSPKDPLIIREAGIYHYVKGDTRRGVALLRQTIELDRSDIMAQYYYGRSLADAGRPDEAIGYFLAVLRAVPEDSEIHEYLARFYARTRQMFKANLHMAYGALYENDQKKLEKFRDKAKGLASSAEEKRDLERFNEQYKERKEFW
jgi:predicted Zn-dependent protease